MKKNCVYKMKILKNKIKNLKVIRKIFCYPTTKMLQTTYTFDYSIRQILFTLQTLKLLFY